MVSVSSIGRMATRSASGKIFSFVFAAVAVAMVLESSTSVPGSKCLWNNAVSTLTWRVLNNRGEFLPAAAPHRATHPEPATLEPLGDTLRQRITARDEDVVPAQRGGLLVPRGGGASENDIRRYDATLYETQGGHGPAYTVAT